MKATTWLWPVVTLLCGSLFVCTAQREFQEFADSSMIQDDLMQEKRTKPSLSIVNPLDVLRQRLLLEIARRQMKENTRQVEINRAILKNVGKRVNLAHMHHPQPHHPHENDIFADYIPRLGGKKDLIGTSDMQIAEPPHRNLHHNDIAADANANDDDMDDDYEMQYLYRLHKNLFIKK